MGVIWGESGGNATQDKFTDSLSISLSLPPCVSQTSTHDQKCMDQSLEGEVIQCWMTPLLYFCWEVEYLTVVVFCRGETKAMTKKERQRQNDWRCMRKERSIKEIGGSNVCVGRPVSWWQQAAIIKFWEAALVVFHPTT